MIDESPTRRSLLRTFGAASTIGMQTTGGCLGATDLTSILPGKQSSTSSNEPPVTSSSREPSTPTETPNPRKQLSLRTRPYTAMTPNPSLVDYVDAYRILATKPRAAARLADRLGDSATNIWPRQQLGTPGTSATFAMRFPSGYYLRTAVDPARFRARLQGELTELAPYRDFERYQSVGGVHPTIVAFTAHTRLIISNPQITDIEVASREIIDRHYGDETNWHTTRDPYAALVAHLPQGLMTEVYPTGRQTTFNDEAAFGQTITLPPGTGSTARVRTVIVFPETYDDARTMITTKLSNDELHRVPVTDPTVEWVDHVAIITDTCGVSEVLW